MKSKSVLAILSASVFLIFAFQNCSQNTSFSKTEQPLQALTADPVVEHQTEQDPPGDVICDPLSGGSKCAITQKHGLIGNIYYLAGSNFQDNFHNAKLDDYFNFGKKVETPLLMSTFNVTNRSFTSGFVIGVDEKGVNVLAKDGAGNDLVEWFAIKVTGDIMVDAEDEGLYQFAVVSDDGGKLKINDQTLIDNDGVHAVVRKESGSLVSLVRNVKQKIEIQYFQGPREMIALEIFARKCERVETGSACAQFGDWKSIPSSALYHD